MCVSVPSLLTLPPSVPASGLSSLYPNISCSSTLYYVEIARAFVGNAAQYSCCIGSYWPIVPLACLVRRSMVRHAVCFLPGTFCCARFLCLFVWDNIITYVRNSSVYLYSTGTTFCSLKPSVTLCDHKICNCALR